MAVLTTIEVFTNQFKASEYLFRGGYLEEPRLLTNLQTVGNHPFVKLCTRDRSLRMFFTGQTKDLLLVQRRLADLLAKLRDDQQDEWCSGNVGAQREEASLEALGGEAEGAPRPRALSAKKMAAMKRALRKQRATVIVPFLFGDESVDMRVLAVQSKNEPPCVEVSMANFRAMFCWCCIEVAQLQGVSPTSRPSRPQAVHGPRQGYGGREYFRRDRMCWFVKRDTERVLADCALEQKTSVCTRRKVGRPCKRARATDGSSDSWAAGESNSALDSSAPSECPDSLQAASPSDSPEC